MYVDFFIKFIVYFVSVDGNKSGCRRCNVFDIPVFDIPISTLLAHIIFTSFLNRENLFQKPLSEASFYQSNNVQLTNNNSREC